MTLLHFSPTWMAGLALPMMGSLVQPLARACLRASARLIRGRRPSPHVASGSLDGERLDPRLGAVGLDVEHEPEAAAVGDALRALGFARVLDAGHEWRLEFPSHAPVVTRNAHSAQVC